MNLKIIILYLITFVDLFAVGLVVPLISSHVISLGGTHFIVGLMGSFYCGLQLFSGPILGSLSDVNGRKPVLIVTLLCCSIAYFCFGCISSIYVLLFLRMVLGVFKHTQTLSKAFVTDIVKSDVQSEVYGKMAAISGVGITLAPVIGGHISEDYPDHGFLTVCMITSILFVVNAGLVYAIKGNKNDTRETSKSDVAVKNINYLQLINNSWAKSIKELKDIDWYTYWDAFLLKGLVGFSMSIFHSNYSPLLKINYNLSPKWIGYTISFQGVVGSCCSFFIDYLNNKFYKNDKNYTQRNLHCFAALTCTFAIMIICNQWYLFVLLLIPIATANAILRLITLEMIVRKSSEKHRGSLIGAANSVRSISGIIGPFVAGSLADLVGVRYVLIVSLVSASIGFAIARSYRKSDKYIKIDKKKK
ncbi:major facilitator superfamily domain-containing protein 9-like [Arctopsyche grandis]|uniref:major facilitator superfamily domain-containing protein 9-like n=1 Tax=Arctopsyche grandis TaxID=121162 RepID=UPI00406D9C19